MRAYQLPEGTGIDALVKVDLPVPKPGPRQVLIKVAACSLNFRDLAISLGTYRMPTKPNRVPLSDGAGDVVEIGAGVTRIKVGNRVAGCFFQRWIGGPPAADTHSESADIRQWTTSKQARSDDFRACLAANVRLADKQ